VFAGREGEEWSARPGSKLKEPAEVQTCAESIAERGPTAWAVMQRSLGGALVTVCTHDGNTNATSMRWPIIRSHTGLGHRWPRTHTVHNNSLSCAQITANGVTTWPWGWEAMPTSRAASSGASETKPQTPNTTRVTVGQRQGRTGERCVLCDTPKYSCVSALQFQLTS